MFNLKQSVTKWRRQMLAAGIKTPVPLEELESHLHEEIERQVQSGFSEQKAFAISVQRIGQPKLLINEFKKNERTFMKRNLKVSAGVVGMILGGGLMTPGFLQLSDQLSMADAKFALWLLGGTIISGSAVLFQLVLRPKVFRGEMETVKMTPTRQTAKIVAGVAVLLTGITLMRPAAAQAFNAGRVGFEGLGYGIFGVAMLLAGAVVAFCPYKKRRV